MSIFFIEEHSYSGAQCGATLRVGAIALRASQNKASQRKRTHLLFFYKERGNVQKSNGTEENYYYYVPKTDSNANAGPAFILNLEFQMSL